MKIRWVLVIGGATALLTLIAALLRPAVRGEFETVAVSRGEVLRTVRASGTIKPLKSVQVGSELSGQVASVLVTANSRVSQGQEMARLTSTTWRTALKRADAEIAAAQALVEQRAAEAARATRILESKERILARQRKLMTQGFIAETALEDSQLDTATAQHELRAIQAQHSVALSDLNKAKVQRAEAADTLARTHILSPISGIVISSQVEPGQTLAASFQTPILFEVVTDLKKMKLEIRVDEADIGDVAVGQPMTFVVDAYPSVPFSGTVTGIQRQGRASDGAISFTVMAAFDNPDEKALPGMSASVRIQTGLRKEVLRLPLGVFLFSPSRAKSAEAASLPRISIVSRQEADRIRQGSPEGVKAPSSRSNTAWKLGDSSAYQPEPVALELGLRGDEFVEVTGHQVSLGERLVLRQRR